MAWALLATWFGIFLAAQALLLDDPNAFRHWIGEDRLVEWLTFIVLVGASAWSVAVCLEFHKARAGRGPCTAWILIAAGLAFGALEEVSWGQRIFGWQSPHFFLVHNAQQELNVHNLVVGGVKLNKLIFGKGLALFILLYVGLLPTLYRKRPRIRYLVEGAGLPIAQNYQILAWLLGALAVRPAASLVGKANELFELLACTLIFLTLYHPFNGWVLPRTRHIARESLREGR